MEPIIINSEFSGRSIGLNMDFLEDKFKTFDIKDISSIGNDLQSKSKGWVQSERETPGLGFTNSVYWVRFTLDNLGKEKEDLYLEVAYPLIDFITMYLPDEKGGFYEKKTGDNLPFSMREISYRNFLFHINAPRGKSIYYLRFETQSSLVLSLLLWNKKSLQEKIGFEGLFLGGYYGILFVMASFNIFLFFSIRDRAYLIYVILIITLGFFQSALSGHAYQFIYPQDPYIANASIPFLMMASLFWIMQFTRYYLNTFTILPKTDRVVKFFLGLIAFFALGSFFSRYSIITPIALIFAILTVISVNVIAFRCILKKSRPAKFYLLAWGFMLGGILIYVLKTLTILPNHFFTNWSLVIGSTAEIILLSFGLADRMNIINMELKKVKIDLEKMSHVKDLFLSNISHEIRTPLTTIYGYSEMIEMSKSKDIKNIKDYNREILSGSEELIGYINDLMLVTDIESLPIVKKENVNLSQLFREISADMSKLMKKNNFEMKIEIPDKLFIDSDLKLLKKAMEVFYKNAVIYSPQQAAGIITAEVIEERVEISVIDFGIGIEEEEIPKIFEKFYRIDTSLQYDVSGMGLGLFIAKRILSLLGGKVDMKSEISMGSTFRIFLPVH